METRSKRECGEKGEDSLRGPRWDRMEREAATFPFFVIIIYIYIFLFPDTNTQDINIINIINKND